MFQKNSLKGSLSKVSSSLVPFPSHLQHSCPSSVSFLFFISSLASHYQPYYSFISQHGSSTTSMAPAISMQPVSWEKRPPSHPPPPYFKKEMQRREKNSLRGPPQKGSTNTHRLNSLGLENDIFGLTTFFN